MSVLKIRDENGNFIPINAIKGDRGERGLPGAGVGIPIEPIGSEIFNDYENNKTNIPYAHIEGKNNTAKIQCLLIESVDNELVKQIDAKNAIYEGIVTLKDVDGLDVCMNDIKTRLENEKTNPEHLLTCAMFYPSEDEIYERMRGSVTSIDVANRKVTVKLGTNVTLPTENNGKWSTTGTFLNTFIVDGGTVGTHEIEDPGFEGFSLHMHGIDNTGYMNALLGGSGNIVKALWGIALGYKCQVDAERGFAVNYKNKITSSGFESAAFGSRNTAGAANSFLTGTDNTSHEGADGSLTCGRYNNLYAAWAAALGYGLEVRNGSSLNAGQYNKHIDKLYLCIGNGKSNTERSNAMTVDWYGNMELAGDIKFKGKSLEQLFNDIESGLDRIIEVQDSLIGGDA